MKAIYKFKQEHGRMGTLEGVFVAEKEHVEMLIKTEIVVDFGEVLGKHSDVYAKIQENELKLITDNPEMVSFVETWGLECGFDPFVETPINIDYEMLGLDEEEDYLVVDVIEHIIKNRIIYIK